MKQSKKKNELGVYRFVHIPGTTKSAVLIQSLCLQPSGRHYMVQSL